jgi:hypothetical protein
MTWSTTYFYQLLRVLTKLFSMKWLSMKWFSIKWFSMKLVSRKRFLTKWFSTKWVFPLPNCISVTLSSLKLFQIWTTSMWRLCKEEMKNFSLWEIQFKCFIVLLYLLKIGARIQCKFHPKIFCLFVHFSQFHFVALSMSYLRKSNSFEND